MVAISIPLVLALVFVFMEFTGIAMQRVSLGALDALTRERLQELILEIWQRTQKMMFFITHDVEWRLRLLLRLGRWEDAYQLTRKLPYADQKALQAVLQQTLTLLDNKADYEQRLFDIMGDEEHHLLRTLPDLQDQFLQALAGQGVQRAHAPARHRHTAGNQRQIRARCEATIVHGPHQADVLPRDPVLPEPGQLPCSASRKLEVTTLALSSVRP